MNTDKKSLVLSVFIGGEHEVRATPVPSFDIM